MIASGTLGSVCARVFQRRAVAAWRTLFQGVGIRFLRNPNALGFCFASLSKTLCGRGDLGTPGRIARGDASRGSPAPQAALSGAAAPVMHGSTSYREKQ